MTPDEIMQVFEGSCPNCSGAITHWKIEGHPDHLAESWSSSENELVPNPRMPRDYTWELRDGWIENILTIVEATCENSHTHYMERSAVSGDWQ